MTKLRTLCQQPKRFYKASHQPPRGFRTVPAGVVADLSKIAVIENAEEESAHRRLDCGSDESSSAMSRAMTTSPSTCSPPSSDCKRSSMACRNSNSCSRRESDSQLVTRYAAVYAFFHESLDESSARLRSFVAKAAQATRIGDVFDDAATAQGLRNHFLRALHCGAIAAADVPALTGITTDELRTGRFIAQRSTPTRSCPIPPRRATICA